MKYIDDLLNRITMYKVVLYYLFALLGLAVVLSALGILSFSPVALLFSSALFSMSCLLANALFSRAYDAVPGSDSAFITALILALIVAPVMPTNFAGVALVIFISFWAIGSKFIFAFGKKHLFNPAALGIALAALLAGQGATWWVAGNLWLMPLLVVGGLLIVRKLQRFDLVLSFAVASLITVGLTSLGNPLGSIITTLTHSSFFFLALVMLTEPATMPPSRMLRIVYGIIAGILFAPAVHIASFYFTPETALLAANIFAYVVSPKGRQVLTLRARNQLANGVYEFVFAPERHFAFRAGQYLEWTLPQDKKEDLRGNRRYFTIASGPGEPLVHLGVKFYEPMSSFKKTLMALPIGGSISAAQLAGDFVLPKDEKKKLVFIAGGIGVTPFRSMVGEMLVTGKKRDAVLLYSNRSEADIAYREVFDAATTRLGMKTVYAVSDGAPASPGIYSGMIDPALITREVPDYKERTFYISGPRGMVVSFTETLKALGLNSSQIKTDFFPGFA